MEHLQMTGTKDTLDVNFDAESGVLALKGASYPENPVDFFDPLYAWVRQYIEEVGGPLAVKVTINYLNTSSSKCILDFLELLETVITRTSP